MAKVNYAEVDKDEKVVDEEKVEEPKKEKKSFKVGTKGKIIIACIAAGGVVYGLVKLGQHEAAKKAAKEVTKKVIESAPTPKIETKPIDIPFEETADAVAKVAEEVAK